MSQAGVWTPSLDQIKKTRIHAFMRAKGFENYEAFHAWSVTQREEFWEEVLKALPIQFKKPYRRILDLSRGVTQAQWCVDGKLNIVDSCFLAAPSALALIETSEAGEPLRRWTYAQLATRVDEIATAIRKSGWQPGDALAVDLPMTGESVALYLGIIKAGCAAISIADSFAPHEIATRLRIAKAKGAFTQTAIRRGGKELPLYSKLKEAEAPTTIILPTYGSPEPYPSSLREGDLRWEDFLQRGKGASRFESHAAQPDDVTGILFSSGTTGDPKAIPWTHMTPIRCATDGLFHQDIGEGTVVNWPTNLGWMMGPWLIYATLMNRGTIALFDGAPQTRMFGEFVEKAGVQVLGLIPSLVKAWRSSKCMEGLNWSKIQCYSSTGECSNESDMAYLMDLAGGKPVIEYCGGTEIGGGYITGTMIQTQRAATFSTPAVGTSFYLIDGEIALVPPSIGLSTTLLNKNHEEVYYDGMPKGERGEVLRRHGDQIEALGDGYFRALGRVDDTMNLGGIKVSSAEIERVLNLVDGIHETAAIAINPPGGGPSLLVIYAVARGSALKELERSAAMTTLQKKLSSDLNPLFRIQDLVWIEALPRTASNKVMRRVLRDQYKKA